MLNYRHREAQRLDDRRAVSLDEGFREFDQLGEELLNLEAASVVLRNEPLQTLDKVGAGGFEPGHPGGLDCERGFEFLDLGAFAVGGELGGQRLHSMAFKSCRRWR